MYPCGISLNNIIILHEISIIKNCVRDIELMKLNIKKIYCPNCKRLVRVNAQDSGDKIQFNCIICDKTLWQKQNLKWKYIKV
jgi:transposase-like protein